MTIDRMALKALLEKGSDEDLLKEMIGFVANPMMELEVEGLPGGTPRVVSTFAQVVSDESRAASVHHSLGNIEQATR